MPPKDRLELLRPREREGTIIWEPDGGIWGAAEQTDKTNFFSKMGIGARSVVVRTVPRADISLHDALRWQGRHLFLTAIIVQGPAAMELSAALVEPVGCTATRPQKQRGTQGRPEYRQQPLPPFPGVLTEKWAGFAQRQPQAEVSAVVVLVTPKLVRLKPGDLVQAAGHGTLAVQICHMTDEYKNEYELAQQKEA